MLYNIINIIIMKHEINCPRATVQDFGPKILPLMHYIIGNWGRAHDGNSMNVEIEDVLDCTPNCIALFDLEDCRIFTAKTAVLSLG